MDNSISKALIMVASVLLAMLVIAFIVHSFMQVGNWATTQDDELLTEQKDKFNKEYEVYDKKLMYGVDVISCLNKALSNNDRINKRKVVNGETYDEDYAVKCSVKINTKLQESITVYYTENGATREKEGGDWDSGYKLNEMTKKFTFLGVSGASQFNDNTELKSQFKSSDMGPGIYVLTYDWNKDPNSNEGKLRAKLEVSNDLIETIKNTGNLECKSIDSEGKLDGKVWTKAVYKSALYDLKTRKFKCTNLTYSDSGRVNYIEFEEI